MNFLQKGKVVSIGTTWTVIWEKKRYLCFEML